MGGGETLSVEFRTLSRKNYRRPFDMPRVVLHATSNMTQSGCTGGMEWLPIQDPHGALSPTGEHE